jgi:hypothetical protein
MKPKLTTNKAAKQVGEGHLSAKPLVHVFTNQRTDAKALACFLGTRIQA